MWGFLAVVVNNPLQGWPILLSVAAPFIFALGFVAKKMWDLCERTEKEKKELVDKIINDQLLAIHAATTALNTNTQSLDELLDFVEDLRKDLAGERELRIRIEERLRADEQRRRQR